MIDILTTLFISAIVILIGFIGNALFNRTWFPEILFLLFLGLLLGPVLQVFPKEALVSVMPFLTTVTLIMVLFSSGMEMNLYKVISQSFRATLLGMLYFALSLLGGTLIGLVVLKFGFLESLMLGSMISGTGAVVIAPLISKLNIRKETALTLSLESTVTDITDVVFFFAILQAIITVSPAPSVVFSSIAAKFSVGIVLGFISGVIWLRLLYMIRNEEYTYMSTIGAIILSYVITETLGGSGVLSSLVFGLVFGNDRDIIGALGMKIDAKELEQVKEFVQHSQKEISFLLRSFFFVFLGLIYGILEIPLAYGIALGILVTVALLVFRYIAAYIATLNTELFPDRKIITLICAQGLADAALSVIPLQFGFANAHVYTAVVVNVVILTNIITTVSVVLIKTNKGFRKMVFDEKEEKPKPAAQSSKKVERKAP